jgi:hypothetical protein
MGEESDVDPLRSARYSTGGNRGVPENRMEWTRELEDLSRKKFGSNYDDTTPPNSNFGGWKRL